MKSIKVTYLGEIPKKFTGIVVWPSGNQYWYKDGHFHREDGPAFEPGSSSAPGLRDDIFWLNGFQYKKADFLRIQYRKHKGTELGNKIAAMILGENNS